MIVRMIQQWKGQEDFVILLNMETTRESSSSKVSALISTLSWTGQLSAKVSLMKWGDWENDPQRDSDQIVYDKRNPTHNL